MEVGRWRGLKRDERKCTECDNGEVEDVKYFLIRCKACMERREGRVDGENEEGSERTG